MHTQLIFYNTSENDVGQTSVKRMFLIPKLSDVPPVIRISIPVQNVASVARYKHVSPTSSGVPCRPNNWKQLNYDYLETLQDFTRVSQITTDMFHLCKHFPHLWLITGFATRVPGRVPLVEQELFTLPEHLSSPPVFSGVRVTQSLVLCVMFCRSLFVLLFFSFGHCVVYFSSIDGFWLPLWYPQSLLMTQFKRYERDVAIFTTPLHNCWHIFS